MSGTNKKLLIDLYNVITKKMELENVSIKEVAAHLGVSYHTMLTYISFGGTIQGKYRVEKKGYQEAMQNHIYPKVKESKIQGETRPNRMDDSFGPEWDEICRNYKLLKAGKATIKPVYVKGKRKYHTVILEGAVV